MTTLRLNAFQGHRLGVRESRLPQEVREERKLVGRAGRKWEKCAVIHTGERTFRQVWRAVAKKHSERGAPR